MLISGGKQTDAQGGQFRIVTGHGAWVMPFFRKVRFLSLETHTVDFSEKCYTNHGITVNVSAVVAFKVDNHPNAITAAAQRFLNDQKKGQMEELTRKIFVGHLRGIVGRMTVEEIIQNREKLTAEVLDGSQSEMSNMGLHVDSLQIETFDDADGSYITDMAKPQRAAIEQAAKIAQAKADQESQAAVQASTRAQAQQRRDTEIAQAQYLAETDRAAAEAAQAGPLADAEAQRAVIEAQRDIAARNALLRESELVAEVLKPAEAERQRLVIAAQAQAEAAEQDAKRVGTTATAEANRMKIAAGANAEQMRLTAAAEAEQLRAVASANAEKIRVEGVASADAAKAAAEADELQRMAQARGERALADAVAANGDAQLRLEQIRMQPQIARAFADGMNLGNAQLFIMNGADGLVQMMAGVIPLMKSFIEQFNTNGSTAVKRASSADYTTPNNVSQNA
jgi:uncharacterized membrane protein YqiK